MHKFSNMVVIKWLFFGIYFNELGIIPLLIEFNTFHFSQFLPEFFFERVDH